MHPRPFLLLIAGFALALIAAGDADAASPVATIDSINPSATEAGTTVFFDGSGSDSDGSVVAYEWTSSIDGGLSDEEDFSMNYLGAGSHTISFRVQDNDGGWSEWDTAVLLVGATLLDSDEWSGDWSDSDGTWSWNSDSGSGTLNSNSFNVWNSKPFLVVEASYDLTDAYVRAQVKVGSQWYDVKWRDATLEASSLYAIPGKNYTEPPDSWTGSSQFEGQDRHTFYADLGMVDEISDGSGLREQYIGASMEIRLRGVSSDGSGSFKAFNPSVFGLNRYDVDVTGITPTSQKAEPSSQLIPVERVYTVKVRNLGAVTDSGVVDFSITVPDNSFVALDCQECPDAILSHIMQQGKETVVAIKPISDSWGGNRDDSNGGDQTAHIDEDGIITWPSGAQDNTSAPGWNIGNPTKASWNYTNGKPMEPSAGSMKDPGEILSVSVQITVGYALWAPPGTYTIQADARSWNDYGSTFTEGDVEGQATMTIDKPDLELGDVDYISHAIGQSEGGLGWSKTSGGDEYFHFHVEVLNTGTETGGTFKVGLLNHDQSSTDVQVSVTGAEIQTGEYVYFKATAAELGMAAGPGESVSASYTYYLAVDTEDDIAESNENNNRQAITITAVSNRTDQTSNLSEGYIGYDTPLNGGTYDCSSELNNYDFESSDNSPTGSTMAQEDSQGTWHVSIVKINPQVSVNSVHWFVLDADDDICAEGRTTDIYGLFLDNDWNILFVDNDLDGKLSPGDKYEIHGLDGVHALRLWYGPPPLSQSAVIDFITPLSAEVSTDISFQGSVASPDNNATYHYIWESSIDGELNDEASFNTSNLSVGFHLITLLIYDSNSSWNDTATEWLIVYTRPTAIAGGDIKIKAGDMVQFLGQASDEDGNITLYEWDFDGNGIYDWSSSMTGLAEFRYSSEGNYSAVLRVTDNDGFTSTDSIVVSVSTAGDDGGGDDGGGDDEDGEGGNPDDSDVELQDDDGFLPAPSLAVAVAALVVIALRRRR